MVDWRCHPRSDAVSVANKISLKETPWRLFREENNKLYAQCECPNMDRVLGGRFLKMPCGLKSKYTRGPCGEAEPRQLPLLPALLHILIAFHLDRDERVNAVSRVRTDETDPATINKCVGNREQEFICCISIFSESLSLKFVHIQCLWVLCWPVGLFTEQQIDVMYSCVCSGVCTAHTAECVSVFAVLLWAAVVERSGWHFKVVRQQLCHDKNIVSEPEEARKQQHCSRMLS